MDIRVTSAYNAYNVQPARSVTQTPRTGAVRANADKVSISSQAGDFQAAHKAAMDAPDVRADLVSNIRGMLDNGTYSVSANDVASRIFREMA